MSYLTPTVSAFKSQFPRDFPYSVMAWGAAGSLTLANGVITAGTVTAGGYGYKVAPEVTVEDLGGNGTGAVVTATVSGGKVATLVIGVGDGGSGYVTPRLLFSGGAGTDADFKKVMDEDIAGAFLDAGFNVNQDMFGSQTEYSRAFNYLAAHMLVMKLTAAGQGLASQYNWLTSSKSVGEVSQSFQIPKRILEDPFLAALSTTTYGAAYLQIISPLLIGNVMTAFRQSLP